MDFGFVGFDSLVGSSSSSSSPSSSPGFGSAFSDPLTKKKLFGYGMFRKQAKPINEDHYDDDDDDESLKGSKRMAKAFSDDLSCPDNGGMPMSLLRSNCSPLFSAVDSHHHDNQMLSFSDPKSSAQDTTLLPYYQLSSVSPSSNKNAGCNTCKNGFTPSQWIELEHQTLIYKYICAHIPIPSTLLLPIRKAFESSGLPFLTGALLRSNALGWGGFHVGFSSGGDPEPGRCRRTDGKKWRCSKDAVTDHKYCERHMNRGRHRSRKPVEGQVQGHSSAAMATTFAKPSPVGGTTTCASVTASKNTFALAQLPQPKHSSRNDSIYGVLMGKNIACSEKQQETSSYFLPKHPNPSHSEFGFVPSECGGSSRLLYFSDQEAEEPPSNQQLLQFMDSWPQNSSQRTQLSDISDFLSSTPNRNKTANSTLSPLRLSCEADPIPMGLGVQGGSSSNIPVSWESSIGGPLGEALHNSSQSSPTGVLQKTTFVSMSNSSAGSSPIADSGRAYDRSSLCTDVLGPFPSLVHCSWSASP